MKALPVISTVAALLVFTGTASAGLYKTITIDGVFDDWAGVPVLDNDAADNVGFVDIADLQIANDDTFLYIRTTYHAASATVAPTFIALDIDQDIGTGFDIFGLGLIGSEAGWSNDFGFDQRNGFNTGALAGGYWGVGAAAFAGDASSREYVIQLDTVFATDTAPLFPDDSFDILIWTDTGGGDVSTPISYTLAAIPEPATGTMLAVFGGAALFIRRKMRR